MRRVRQVLRGGAVRQVRPVRLSRQLRHVRWLLLIAFLPTISWAQPSTENVEVDPVTCWWRAGVASVRVGETFPVRLTCSVLESDAVRAVVDRSRLGAAAVQFPPYEVVSGSQGADHVTVGRRFMQYEYLLRLIGEDAFGVDVPITGMELTYRIESRVQRDAAVQGREQSYQLPPIPMRVTSLVPDDARSIRESAVPAFADIGAREFRARLFRLVALVLFGIAALTVAVALLRWVREGRSAGPQAARPLLSNRAVVAGVRRELAAIQHETRAGWTTETVARALAAGRIAASYQTDRPVVQRRADGRGVEGELTISGGFPSRRRVAVSGSATAQAPNVSTTANHAASELDAALLRLTAARYGRTLTLDASILDDALETLARTTHRVAARHTWAAEAMRSLRQSLRGWRPQAWAR